MPSGSQIEQLAPERSSISAWIHHAPGLLLGAGLIIRLWFAHAFFLNPDEALHFLLSLQPNLRMTYEATLPTSHPPLYIVFLHYWGYLGHTEFFLRLPSVLAATAFCWFMFRWVRFVAGNSAAVICLVLLLFSPSLIYVSAELRQYAFVLFFCGASIYFLELGLQKNISSAMLVSGVSLWLALLTHYSAVLVALPFGLYALWRMRGTGTRGAAVATWAAGQAAALAIAGILFKTQILQLKTRGRFAMAAETYLKRSSFHPGQEHAISFVLRATVRLFHYFFSQGAVGVMALALYIAAIVFLARHRRRNSPAPSSAQLIFLMTFPLLVNSILGLKDIYPYGGTRHSSYLTIFIFPGIAIALARMAPKREWMKGTAIGLALLLCNLFPSPTGEYIRHHDQKRAQMWSAVNFLKQNAGPGALIVTDNQGGLLLSYYLCDSKVVPFSGVVQHFSHAPCGNMQVFSLDPRQWIFHAQTFPDDLLALKSAFNLASGQRLWIFQSGWLVDNEADFREELAQFGCPATHDFGRNILACEIALP
ncbi:MAG TPA: glycosyltransferase family 39 protein [Terriglobales bacterium]|jgi:4-amino-4-deoxy-L-arabinose transferase-like glycosyltransferase